jgi:hypothetical protein
LRQAGFFGGRFLVGCARNLDETLLESWKKAGPQGRRKHFFAGFRGRKQTSWQIHGLRYIKRYYGVTN